MPGVVDLLGRLATHVPVLHDTFNTALSIACSDLLR